MSSYDEPKESAPKPIEFQVRRMRQMKGYPVADDRELIRVASKYSPGPDQLCDAISDLIEGCLSCPSSAELKGALLARQPDREPAWVRDPAQEEADAKALLNFFAENEQIMVNARRKEKEQALKDKQVREFLHIRDFMDVDFPQRWWAEQQLGFTLSPVQQEDIKHWLASLGPKEDPHVVVKRNRAMGETLGDMGFQELRQAEKGTL